MVTYRCDGCGKELKQRALRYHVTIDVRAAYDKLEVGLMDLVRDHRAEILSLIEAMKERDPRELEETIYKCIELDLCPPCQRAFIRDPLHFHPERGGTPPSFDVDAFLRSLGIPGDDTDPEG